jgi:hypothetical protein
MDPLRHSAVAATVNTYRHDMPLMQRDEANREVDLASPHGALLAPEDPPTTRRDSPGWLR